MKTPTGYQVQKLTEVQFKPLGWRIVYNIATEEAEDEVYRVLIRHGLLHWSFRDRGQMPDRPGLEWRHYSLTKEGYAAIARYYERLVMMMQRSDDGLPWGNYPGRPVWEKYE